MKAGGETAAELALYLQPPVVYCSEVAPSSGAVDKSSQMQHAH